MLKYSVLLASLLVLLAIPVLAEPQSCSSDDYSFSPGLLDKAVDKTADDFLKGAAKEVFVTIFRDLKGGSAGLTEAMKEFDETLKRLGDVYDAVKVLEASASGDFAAARKYAVAAAAKKGIEASFQAALEAIGSSIEIVGPTAGYAGSFIPAALVTAIEILLISRDELYEQDCLLQSDILIYALLEDRNLRPSKSAQSRIRRFLNGYIAGEGMNVTNTAPRKEFRGQLQCYIDTNIPEEQRITIIENVPENPFSRVSEAMAGATGGTTPESPALRTAANILLHDVDLKRVELVSKNIIRSPTFRRLAFLSTAVQSQPIIMGILCEQYQIYEFRHFQQKFYSLRDSLKVSGTTMIQKMHQLQKQLREIQAKLGQSGAKSDSRYRQIATEYNQTKRQYIHGMNNLISRDTELASIGISTYDQFVAYGKDKEPIITKAEERLVRMKSN